MTVICLGAVIEAAHRFRLCGWSTKGVAKVSLMTGDAGYFGVITE